MAMADTVIEELNSMDREHLMERMASRLPWISGELGYNIGGLATRTGLDMDRMSLIAAGRRKMKWSEYMSILFVLWSDGKGREIVEEEELFPDALKRAMSINRNAHGEKT